MQWWVLRDVCKVLDLSTPARVADRLGEDEVSQAHITDALNRQQQTTIVNESGLYTESKGVRKTYTLTFTPKYPTRS